MITIQYYFSGFLPLDRKIEWKMLDPKLDIDPASITGLTASGDELEAIKFSIDNIPINRLKDKISWRDPYAAFIYENIIFKGYKE